MLVEMKHVKKHYRDFSLDCSLQLKEGGPSGEYLQPVSESKTDRSGHERAVFPV